MSGSNFSLLRAFRLLRLVKLLRRLKGPKELLVSATLHHFVHLEAVIHFFFCSFQRELQDSFEGIANVFVFMVAVLCMTSILGMQLFGDLAYESVYGDFNSFPNGVIVAFQVCLRVNQLLTWFVTSHTI